MADEPRLGGLAAERRSLAELRFVVVGAYVMDCFVSTPRFPAWGHEQEARSIRTTPGGKALNQAVALARLGAQVAAVGVVGDDGLGRDVLAALRRERVDVSWLETRDGVATTLCLCFVSDEGESAIVWHIDDDVAVTPETVQAASSAFEDADAVLMTFEMPVPTIRETLTRARHAGARVFVQPAPSLADSSAAESLPWDQVDVLVPNEAEARTLLSGKADALAAHSLADALAALKDVPTVVVTLGESGCVAHAAGASRWYPVQKTVAIDTTGAGDAFMATFAADLTSGTPVPDAVDAAQAAAAWAISHHDGHESMPTKSDIDGKLVARRDDA